MSRSLKFILFGFLAFYLSCKSFGMDNPSETGNRQSQEQKLETLQQIIIELDKRVNLQNEENSELRKQIDSLNQRLGTMQTEASAHKKDLDILQRENAGLAAIIINVLLYGAEIPEQQRQELLITLISFLNNIRK